MKKKLTFIAFLITCALSLQAQGVTQLNNNDSLEVYLPLSNGKTILRSGINSSIWATNGTAAGTIQISPDITFDGSGSGITYSGKLIFRGSRTTTGAELYITDGTAAGTTLVKDIYAGSAGSYPENFTLLNGYVYFTADDGSHGRELWRTNGTAAGTTLVKDIQAGATGSFNINGIDNFGTNGTYIFFAANTTGSGNELWKSDGTAAGTVLLKEINTGHSNADSSNPHNFYTFNSMVLFLATDATHGEELWKTDGTAAGTVLVKDINPGTGSSTTFSFFGISSPVFKGFHTFNNHVIFNADDGASTGEIWSTDGTAANTILLSDVVHGSSISLVSVILGQNLASKFIFPVSNLTTRSELWESDGTAAGTKLFKSFSVVGDHRIPFIFPTLVVDFATGTGSQPLFQGSKFFFVAATTAAGAELWVSDGTLAGTNMVKDIYPGTGDGIDATKWIAFLYTSGAFYFDANDGVNGNEMWKTDGTAAGTSMVANIYPGIGDANPDIPIFLCNNKIIFSASDGEDLVHTDLYAVNGTFGALPVKLTDFTVTASGSNALLQWTTQQEINSKSFVVQRSYDAQHFEDIGNVNAAGTSYVLSRYAFTDYGVLKSGRSAVYYRLNMIDRDGASSFTNVITLKINGENGWSVHLLSNPVQDDIRLMIINVPGNLELNISDINGRILFRKELQNVNGEITLPVTLSKGMYLLEAKTNNERKTIKVVK